jgi:ABC-type transport system involved in multi-copper enzyme maturation permease subunit
MSLFSIIITIFVGVNLVYKELERKTIYTLIPKPLHRYQFVMGKFFGMVITLAVLLAVMTLVLLAVRLFQGGDLSTALSKMVLLIFFEVVVITAVAVFFSSFSTPLLSGMFTVGVFLLGRSVPDILQVADRVASPILAGLLRTLARLMPDLRYLYVTGSEAVAAHASVHANFPDWSYVGMAAGYAILYAAIVLLLAMGLFARRDFV